MRRILGLALICAFSLGCNGKGPEVAALVATGAALKVAQIAQSGGGPLTSPLSTEECTLFCGPCEVPCGDHCMPYGALCYEPTGSACYGGDASVAKDRYPSPDAGCARDPGFLLPLPIAH